MCDTDCIVAILQYITLIAAIFMWLLYRVAHPAKGNPIFRIEKVKFNDGRVAYYCSQRKLFNRWKTIEIEKDIKGYPTLIGAERAMEFHLKQQLGLELTETTVEKEYG